MKKVSAFAFSCINPRVGIDDICSSDFSFLSGKILSKKFLNIFAKGSVIIAVTTLNIMFIKISCQVILFKKDVRGVTQSKRLIKQKIIVPTILNVK